MHFFIFNYKMATIHRLLIRNIFEFNYLYLFFLSLFIRRELYIYVCAFILFVIVKRDNILFLSASDWIDYTIINIWYYENIHIIFWGYIIASHVYLWLQDLLRFRYLHKFVVSFGQGSRETLRDLEKNRVSLQKEVYTGIFIPNVAMNQCHEYDETTTLIWLYIRRMFLIYDESFFYPIGHSKLLHFTKNYY